MKLSSGLNVYSDTDAIIESLEKAYRPSILSPVNQELFKGSVNLLELQNFVNRVKSAVDLQIVDYKENTTMQTIYRKDNNIDFFMNFQTRQLHAQFFTLGFILSLEFMYASETMDLIKKTLEYHLCQNINKLFEFADIVDKKIFMGHLIEYVCEKEEFEGRFTNVVKCLIKVYKERK